MSYIRIFTPDGMPSLVQAQGMPVKFATYFHTIRYLRGVQFYGRLWFRLYKPRPKLWPIPSLRPCTGTWQPPARRLPSQYAPRGFRFLNQAHELQSPNDWNNPRWDKLWLYNLHYFDDLNARDATERDGWHRDLIERWIAENPPAYGNGWEPYPLSLRLVNWIKWTLAGNALEPNWLDSLAIQTRYLCQRLEHHLLGNHLFANAKALVFAGLFFSSPEADRWLNQSLSVLRRQLPEQVLADGGHFERSPLYHSIILEDLLDLLNLARVYPGVLADEVIAAWRAAAQSMRGWLLALCHPDGQIALFNDAALEIAPLPAELETYARRLGLNKPPQSPFHLADTGYIRLQQGPAVALLDVGEIGPDYLPGHAHADTLSFELSVFGERLLVNSGTSCYGTGAERLRQRSTVAHNTVVVDGQNSSEVWGGFRVARRARPLGLEVQQERDALQVVCGHNGYRRLSGRPLHWRQWVLSKNSLTVSDRLEGTFTEAVAHFHFHPAIALYMDPTGQQGIARLPNAAAVHWQVLRGRALLKASTYHPRFGTSKANRRLEVHLDGTESQMIFHW